MQFCRLDYLPYLKFTEVIHLKLHQMMSRNSSSRKSVEISISNTLVCPFEVVDCVLNCSKLLEGLLSEFESSSLCTFDPNKTAILGAIKLKLEVALFQVNAAVDGSLINMDKYLKSKKQDIEFNFAITSREISNFRNIVSCYEPIDVAESIQSSVSKVSNFRTPKRSFFDSIEMQGSI
jgi:hypothetical protein